MHHIRTVRSRAIGEEIERVFTGQICQLLGEVEGHNPGNRSGATEKVKASFCFTLEGLEERR